MGLYTTLDISKREIRLLRVLPSNDSAEADNANPPICCELSVHRLNYSSTTPYTALSYSWGPELTTPKMLTVNGEAIPARKNLLSALHAFRRRGDVGYVWVDAVCINQDDHEEKKTQIPLMGDIYGLAVQTIIWLGATEGDSDVAMDTLDSLGPGDFEVTRFSEAQCRRWRAVMALLQRSWCKYFSVFPCLISDSKIPSKTSSSMKRADLPLFQGQERGSCKKHSCPANQSRGAETRSSPSNAS